MKYLKKLSRRLFLCGFILIAAKFSGTNLQAQCVYPCWSVVTQSAFSSYQAYPSTLTTPSVSSPFYWSLPYPAASSGGNDSSGCTYGDDYIDGIGNDYPMDSYPSESPGGTHAATAIYRSQEYLYRTSYLTGVRGIAVDANFTGSVNSSDNPPDSTLVQSTYYHSQRCTTAGVEFGFRRVIGGLAATASGYIEFYYSQFTNCDSGCQVTFPSSGSPYSQTGTTTVYPQVGGPVLVPVPSGTNYNGGTDWLYEAWLNSDGSQWNIVVLDPSTYTQQGTTVNLSVATWFGMYASYMLNNGGMSGYMELTNSGGGWATTPSSISSVSMNVVNVFAP